MVCDALIFQFQIQLNNSCDVIFLYAAAYMYVLYPARFVLFYLARWVSGGE